MAAAAWHRDPTARHELRYYDGAEWTEHVSDQGQLSVDPLQPAAPATAAEPLQSAPVAAELPRYSPDEDLGDLNSLPAPAAPAPLASPSAPHFKLRSPIAVIILTIITLGIYGLFWYYYVNRELAEIGMVEGDPEYGDDPGTSLLAVTWGSIIIVPALISTYHTGLRVNHGLDAETQKTKMIPAGAIVAILAVAAVANLFSGTASSDAAGTVLAVIFLLSLGASLYFLYSVQTALNLIHERYPTPALSPTIRMSGGQITLIVLWVLLPIFILGLLVVFVIALLSSEGGSVSGPAGAQLGALTSLFL